MANAKSKRRVRWVLIVVTLLGAAVAAFWFTDYGQRLRGDAAAGSAYGARVACSCRFVAGRSMADCRKDKLAGMELVRLSADEDKRSVTASVPLIASETASLRPGYGCVLESWQSRES